MISINLLRRTASGRKKKIGRSGWVFRVAVMMAIGVGIVVAGVELMRWWITEPALRLSPVPEQKNEIENTIQPETIAPKSIVTARTTAAPESSRTLPAAPVGSLKTTAVAKPGAENVKTIAVNPAVVPVKPVPAISSVKQGMSKADSIRYRISFANRVLAAFSYDLPPDVEFTDIAIDSFNNVAAAGVISSREGAEKFFSTLPEKKFNLYPPPHTYIRPNGSRGFRFRI